MKLAAILAAAIIAGGTSFAMAQAGGGGAASGAGASGAGSDVSTPRKNQAGPTKNSPTVSRRGDDMPPGMNAIPWQKQQSNAKQKKI